MSRSALLSGTIGGIIGVITASLGVSWLFVFDSISSDIGIYVSLLGIYFTGLFGTYTIGGVKQFQSFPYPIPYFPSWSLFGVSSLILAAFLIMTGILIGAGFYGMYKIGGGAASVIGMVSSVIGITAGALSIVMVNLTAGYEQTWLMVGQGEASGMVPFFPVLTPNFPFIVIGFIILGFTFIMLGSASISIREMTEKPRASQAAGILSIGVAVFIVLCSLLGSIPVRGILGGLSNNITFGIFFGGIIGFLPILIAFILWAWVFYSSRNL
jgi:hypothetical protein